MNNVIKFDRSRISKFKSSLIKTQDISYIGKCIGCGEMDLLIDNACTSCVDVYGNKCGVVFEAIRKDPQFALCCYNKLQNPKSKKYFIKLFGSVVNTGKL